MPDHAQHCNVCGRNAWGSCQEADDTELCIPPFYQQVVQGNVVLRLMPAVPPTWLLLLVLVALMLLVRVFVYRVVIRTRGELWDIPVQATTKESQGWLLLILINQTVHTYSLKHQVIASLEL